jgi:hypothetical protein
MAKATEHKQTGSLVNPDAPETANRFPYYLLEEMNSPPISTPNAVRWEAYPAPRFVNDPPDGRVAYGFIEYEAKLSWEDLKRYNMLPFDYDESVLFDLWQSFDEDKAKLLAFFKQFFSAIKGDKELRRLGLAVGLVRREWTLKKTQAAIEEIA